MKIAIITDSLGMERPVELGDVPPGLAYPILLARRLVPFGVNVSSYCQRARTMDQALEQVKTLPSNYFDLIIIHAGIVDCAPRVLTRTERASVAQMPPNQRDQITAYIKKNRAKIILNNPPKVYTAISHFKKYSLDIVQEVQLQGAPALCFVNIIEPCLRMEEASPGIQKNARAYNAVIHQLKDKPGVYVFDANELINSSSRYDYYMNKDGHHLSREGGVMFAIKLQEFIQSSFLLPKG